MSKEKKISIVVAVTLVLLSLVSIVYASIEKSRASFELHVQQCRSVEKYKRIDAALGLVKTEEDCWAINGCWDGTAVFPTPKCHYSFADKRGYSVVNSTVTVFGMEFDLVRNEQIPKMYTTEVDQLKCVISYETDSRLRVRIFDPKDKDRYVVPMSEHHEQAGHRMQYILTATHDLFGFSVSRTHEASSTIFNTSMEGLIFSDQLIQLNMMLSTSKVYGLQYDGLLRRMEYTTQSLWARKDHGAHPFFMHLEHDGHASGYLLQNSDAMDIVLNPYPAVSFRTTGGILDFYIFLGPTPANVIEQFTAQIGAPFLPPLWALGYHYGSAKYESSDQIKDAEDIDIPLDGLWLGQNIRKDEIQFTVNSDKFGGLGNISRDLGKLGKHLFFHATPAVRVLESNEWYTSGKKEGLFVKDSQGNNIVSTVDGKDTVFPDYFHPATKKWFKDSLTSFSLDFPHSGLLLTENEPSTDSTGSKTGCTDETLDNPLYTLFHVKDLKQNTLCPSAKLHGGLRHADVHNIYGWASSQTTQQVQKSLSTDNKRRLTLSRSTYVGSGVHAGHWIQDIPSTWDGLNSSITAILNYNFFGMPLVGTNICGDWATVDEELCVRWYQLATYFPFAKRFSSSGTSPETEFTPEATSRIKSSIEARYRLLPYLYSQFYLAHTVGAMVVKPLFFDYLADNATLDIVSQFMLGDAIMVTPVTNKGVTKREVYFPGGADNIWYDGVTRAVVGPSKDGRKEIPVTMDTIPTFIRGGSVVVRHLNVANSSAEMLKSGDYILEVYLASDKSASGLLFVDDGVSDNTISKDMYQTVSFNASGTRITSEVKLLYPGYNNTNTLREIVISGLEKAPTSVEINESGYDWTSHTYKDGILHVTGLTLQMQKAFCVSYES